MPVSPTAWPRWQVTHCSRIPLYQPACVWIPYVLPAPCCSPCSESFPRWQFFAVSYDSTKPKANVQWYFGNSKAAAAPDAKASGGDYNKGKV